MRQRNITVKKSSGSVTDVLSVVICMIAMSIIMMAYLNSIQLLNTKSEVSQLARKYILRMETVGYLTGSDKAWLTQELNTLGISDPDFSGTTMNEVGYGSPVILSIQGNINGKEAIWGGGIFAVVFGDKSHPFQEIRMSTAKN